MATPTPHPLEAVVSEAGRVLARCVLRRGRYTIGQERRSEIMVDAPSISARHAVLTVEGDDEFILEDLASANGTRVNGHALTGPVAVTLDCAIELGSTTLDFQRGGLPATVFQFLPEDCLGAPRYAVGEPIVEGRTSIIHEARDLALGREVAMKMLRPEAQAQAGSVLHFIREAQIAAQLQHPGILPVHDLGLDDRQRLYATTRFVEGEILPNLLAPLLSPEEHPEALRPSLGALLAVFQRACDAVAYAHSRGVVHCTLRPETLTVGRFGEVFVNGWGLAKVFLINDEEVPRVQVPEAGSEPSLSRYCAPEQAEGALEDIDTRTDIHALGGILFYLLTLRDPIRGETDSELLEQALSPRDPPAVALAGEPPYAHWPGGRLPEALAAIAMKALSLARDDRHQSVPALQHEIAAWQEGGAQGEAAGGLWKGFTGLLGRH